MGTDSDSCGAGDSDAVTVHVRCSNGSKFSVQITLDSTVGAFKAALVEKYAVPAEQQRLIYKGRILKDEHTLESYAKGLEFLFAPLLSLFRKGVQRGECADVYWPSKGSNAVNARYYKAPRSLGTHLDKLRCFVLKNIYENKIKEKGLESDHTIHLVRGLTSPAASADVTTASNGASRIPANSAGIENGGTNEGPQFGGADIGGSLFPGLGVNRRDGNGSGFLGFGLPDINQMQQQLAQNPSMMTEIMNMPAVQSLMSNPDLLRNMIMNNPQMREIIDRNPDFAHVLNDPSTLRQSLEVMRNPELMRELMRNTDRAMSNIEASPEGFNALRRMYETVQEPFLNATTGAGNMRNDLAQNPFAALLGNQSATQARDQTATGSDVTAESAAPNSNPLPNPWSSTGVAGLGGLGLPDLERMAGGMPDPSLLNQLLQNPAIMQMMQSLVSNPQFMNQNQTGGGTAVPPEERYATQLSQLQEMGFFDTQENIRALSATSGNVHAAVDWLLRNLDR
ncbi:hypothetical protein B296_00022837 [Ensete ventricosum]|uniref:Ubiquilin n=1 Tax=Ensete ventricosum TaxID=4639 RepID=A0A427ASX1_ENSVE|nr:hypothetical protein B296_00022837 [Ensete ventricosum]